MTESPRQIPVVELQETEVVRFDQTHPAGQHIRDVVISESPLNIQVDGTTYTLLRTPGKDRELVVGFLFTEGLIDTFNDIMLLAECPDSPNVITIKTRLPKEKPQRTLIITSSCGLCGRDDIDGLLGSLGRIESDLRIPLEQVYRVPAAVRQLQTLFGSTGSAHASALIQPDGPSSPLKKGTGSEPTSENPAKNDGREVPVPLFQRAAIQCVREDVGRHNALDKLIGYSLMSRLSMANMAVFLSGRTSIELIIKAAKARIPILLAVGAPTGAAVDTAERLGITLCGFLRDNGVSVYSHEWRIIASRDGRPTEPPAVRKAPPRPRR